MRFAETLEEPERLQTGLKLIDEVDEMFLGDHLSIKETSRELVREAATQGGQSIAAALEVYDRMYLLECYLRLDPRESTLPPIAFDDGLDPLLCREALQIAADATGHSFEGEQSDNYFIVTPSEKSLSAVIRNDEASVTAGLPDAPHVPGDAKSELFSRLVAAYRLESKAYGQSAITADSLVAEIGDKYFGTDGSHIAQMLYSIWPAVVRETTVLQQGRIEASAPLEPRSGGCSTFASALAILATAHDRTFVGNFNGHHMIATPDTNTLEIANSWAEAQTKWQAEAHNLQ